MSNNIRSLVVRMGGKIKSDGGTTGRAIDVAHLTNFDIELDDQGGPLSAALTIDDALVVAPGMMGLLDVAYLGHHLFVGRLETRASKVTASARGWRLTYGPILDELTDDKGFLAPYVDSDLGSWQTDQGPRTSPDIFNIATIP